MYLIAKLYCKLRNLFTGVSVRFNQPMQSINESNGFIQTVLALNSPSSVNITIHVFSIDGSALGKFL